MLNAAVQSAWKSGMLDPQGPVATAELLLLQNATLIMLTVVLPVIVLTLGFAWWFRPGNPRARRMPQWRNSGSLELLVWSVPTLIVLFLGGIAWLSSRELDPRRPLSATSAAFEVEVVSLDWKWLFIYPDERLASVNELTVPAGRPLHLRLTSASVMNSFSVPQLGSQIYTMAGMETQLNIEADRSGEFTGFSAQFSGEHFSDMRFTVRALAPGPFASWLRATRARCTALDATAYAQLAEPGVASARSYCPIDTELFASIIARVQQP